LRHPHGDRKGRHYYTRASRPQRRIVREAIAALLTCPQHVGRRRFAHAGGMLAMRGLPPPCSLPAAWASLTCPRHVGRKRFACGRSLRHTIPQMASVWPCWSTNRSPPYTRESAVLRLPFDEFEPHWECPLTFSLSPLPKGAHEKNLHLRGDTALRKRDVMFSLPVSSPEAGPHSSLAWSL